jgi:hypothetical protein
MAKPESLLLSIRSFSNDRVNPDGQAYIKPPFRSEKRKGNRRTNPAGLRKAPTFLVDMHTRILRSWVYNLYSSPNHSQISPRNSSGRAIPTNPMKSWMLERIEVPRSACSVSCPRAMPSLSQVAVRSSWASSADVAPCLCCHLHKGSSNRFSVRYLVLTLRRYSVPRHFTTITRARCPAWSVE